MMDIVTLTNKVLALLTILGNVSIIVIVLFFIFDKKDNLGFFKFLAQYGLVFAFLVSAFSTAASLFYSQIAGFAPCDLCWLQRIFMYPQVLLLGAALFKKDLIMIKLGLGLSFLGLFAALYHNVIYYYQGGLNNNLCQFVGRGISCAKRYVFEFGYVTIPAMALTAFALMILFLTLYLLKGRFADKGQN